MSCDGANWPKEWTGLSVSVLPIWKFADDRRPWEGMQIPLSGMFCESVTRTGQRKKSDVSLGGSQFLIRVPETHTGGITIASEISSQHNVANVYAPYPFKSNVSK
jgi:hypothetical protein